MKYLRLLYLVVNIFLPLVVVKVTYANNVDEAAIVSAVDLTSAALISNVGIGFDHRSFQGAAQLGESFGFDFGLSLSLSELNSALGTSLEALIGAKRVPEIPFLPSPRLQGNISLGSFLAFGVSYFPSFKNIPYLKSINSLGLELKVLLISEKASQEGGFNFALRLSHNNNSIHAALDGTSFMVSTTTWTPQILFSKSLDIFEPYMGTAYQYVIGSVSTSLDLGSLLDSALLAKSPFQNFLGSISQTSSFGALSFFGGLAAHFVAFKLVLEGSYYPNGMNTIGLRLGFNF